MIIIYYVGQYNNNIGWFNNNIGQSYNNNLEVGSGSFLPANGKHVILHYLLQVEMSATKLTTPLSLPMSGGWNCASWQK